MSSLSRARAQLVERLGDFASREYGITDKRFRVVTLPRCYARRMYDEPFFQHDNSISDGAQP